MDFTITLTSVQRAVVKLALEEMSNKKIGEKSYKNNISQEDQDNETSTKKMARELWKIF